MPRPDPAPMDSARLLRLLAAIGDHTLTTWDGEYGVRPLTRTEIASAIARTLDRIAAEK